MGLEARTDTFRFGRFTVACCALALLLPVAAIAAHSRPGAKRAIHTTPQHARHLPYPSLELPMQINGSQYEPLAWTEIAGLGR